jgi:hypothetical protein
VPPQRWVFDSGCSGEGLSWRQHLLDSGLDPAAARARTETIRTANGVIEVPTRKCSLWLFSNNPALREFPFRMSLSPGLPFRDDEWPEEDTPDHHPPIVGLLPLIRAGVRVEMCCRRKTLSVWVPGRWGRGVWQGISSDPWRVDVLDPPWSPHYWD